ncbi:phosphatase PAP2 family protein [Leucobacter sp. NPDC058333]|uniref:phosphatase PAP2 family protein n=1 Tax=Leucobacter sp. NPDC058333 TaxID=3346450 RepID=UPI0036584DAC
MAAFLIALVTVLLPGINGSVSVAVTRMMGAAGFEIPGARYLSDAALVLLAVGVAVAMMWSWRARPHARAVVAATAIGVVLAYGMSELAKLVFQQARPCTVWPGVGECDASDYSFPSNHATLAFGAVCVIAFAGARLWTTLAAIVVAVFVAAGRLLEGAHYLHDVAAAALLGIFMPVLLGVAKRAWHRKRHHHPTN